MKIHSNTKQKSANKWLFILLAVTVILTAWMALNNDAKNTDTAIDLVSKSNKSAKNSDQVPQKIALLANQNNLIPWQKLKREPRKYTANDLFKVHSWVVIPPVKKIKPLPPPLPVAPPAPFTYFGEMEDPPKSTMVFLMANGKVYSVVTGEKIDGQWRLDAVDANALHLTYLPLNLVQILAKSARPDLVAPVATPDMNL